MLCFFGLTGASPALLQVDRDVATMPTLDPTVHASLQLVATDRAAYRPTAAGRVLVHVRNRTISTFVGRVTATIYRDAVAVQRVTAQVTVQKSANVVAAIPFRAPGREERGYRVAVVLRDESGIVRDTAVTAIDVQTSPLHARFPRPCWISHWDGATDAATLIASQVAWHCNTVQSYASYYRPELSPPSSLSSWRSLSKLTISRAAVHDVITAAHAANMPVGFFQATGEAYSSWPEQAIRPSLAWGSFRNRCGLRNACTAHDLDRSPQPPENWSKYGWEADHLDFFDPCSAGWRDFLLSHSISPMIEQFHFDFWQADTVGAPVQPTFDVHGRLLDTSRCLTDFVSEAQSRLGVPIVLNTVSGWGLIDAVRNGRQPYLYRETWNFDTPFYPAVNGVVADINAEMGDRGGRAIVEPAYINRRLAARCASPGQIDGCFVNTSAALLATAMFAIAGSTWMNHADHGCIVTNVFIEGYQLPCLPATVTALLSYKAFEVAYETLLRGGTRASTQPCEIMSGGKGSAVGAAGEIYILGKLRPGYQICQLLNLTGVSSNDWTDLDGTKEAPKATGALRMKLYYSGNSAKAGKNMLWAASPDNAGGAAQSLAYTTGIDRRGHYVAFRLPTLQYWTMIVLDKGENG